MKRKILKITHINRGYGSNVYKVYWCGNYSIKEIINAIDSGNYGGFAEIKRKFGNIINITSAIVTVYTD